MPLTQSGEGFWDGEQGRVESEVFLDMLVPSERCRRHPNAMFNRQLDSVSLDRAWEPPGIETEMWESLACRILGAWEKGEGQGATYSGFSDGAGLNMGMRLLLLRV